MLPYASLIFLTESDIHATIKFLLEIASSTQLPLDEGFFMGQEILAQFVCAAAETHILLRLVWSKTSEEIAFDLFY